MFCNTAATLAALQNTWSGQAPTPQNRIEDIMKRSEKRNRTKLIQVRCTPEEHEMIVQSAEAAYLTVGEYVRRIAMHRRIAQQTDHKLIAELSRMGSLQKELFIQGGKKNTQEFIDIMNEIRGAIMRIH